MRCFYKHSDSGVMAHNTSRMGETFLIVKEVVVVIEREEAS